MKPTRPLCCPNGCKTVEQDFKLIRVYGPHRTPFYRCLQCKREFSARADSVFAGFHTDEQTIYRVLKALAEGNGIRACGRIFELDKNTVSLLLEQAAAHCQKVSEGLLQNYHLAECQLDELWSFVKKRKRTSPRWKNWQPSTATSGSGSASTHAKKSSCTSS